MKIPPEVIEKIKGNNLEKVAIKVEYTNYKGEVGIRNIIPLEMLYGATEHHKEEQWLLKLWDLDKKDYRTYALKDITRWISFP